MADAARAGAAGEAPGTTGDAEEAARRSRGVMTYGCEHYRRRCALVAPCCGKVFTCRHCHNKVQFEQETDVNLKHELVRKDVKEVVCLLCDTRQPVGPTCTSCGVDFGAYYCEKCQFYDDDVSRQQFHCEGCGICRVGGKTNFFHCDRCGCCYSTTLRNEHKCIENSMRRQCPVCLDYLFDSVKPISVLVRCGHAMHEACLQSLHENSLYRCPLCAVSTIDTSAAWSSFDERIRRNHLPPIFRNLHAEIHCNECGRDGVVPYHFLGLKCSYNTCGSYNTTFLKAIQGENEGDTATQSHGGTEDMTDARTGSEQA